jgi:hypothetical protein
VVQVQVVLQEEQGELVVVVLVECKILLDMVKQEQQIQVVGAVQDMMVMLQVEQVVQAFVLFPSHKAQALHSQVE